MLSTVKCSNVTFDWGFQTAIGSFTLYVCWDLIFSTLLQTNNWTQQFDVYTVADIGHYLFWLWQHNILENSSFFVIRWKKMSVQMGKN